MKYLCGFSCYLLSFSQILPLKKDEWGSVSSCLRGAQPVTAGFAIRAKNQLGRGPVTPPREVWLAGWVTTSGSHVGQRGVWWTCPHRPPVCACPLALLQITGLMFLPFKTHSSLSTPSAFCCYEHVAVGGGGGGWKEKEIVKFHLT